MRPTPNHFGRRTPSGVSRAMRSAMAIRDRSRGARSETAGKMNVVGVDGNSGWVCFFIKFCLSSLTLSELLLSDL